MILMYFFISNFDRPEDNYYPQVFFEECKYVLKRKEDA